VKRVTDTLGRYLGRLIEKIDGLNNENIYQYDNNNNVEKVVDTLGRVTLYEYDELNRKVREIERYNELESTKEKFPSVIKYIIFNKN